MNVIFICQCQKKSLIKTRRVLDAYANRIGDNVWQTSITEDGLIMVRKLLRQSASKNTAVACHKIKTRNRTELVWVVGNKNEFNESGFVPVNKTKRSILHFDWENDWQFLNAISIVSVISALMHDLGKSSVGFQDKLKKSAKTSDPYRHEWLSLKLFLWLVQNCQTDNEIFERFLTVEDYLAKTKLNIDDLVQNIEKTQLHQLPPIANWIAWLIVTHHRLPALTDYYFKDKKKYLQSDNRYLKVDLNTYYKSLFKPMEYWVKNPNCDVNIHQFFAFNDIVWGSPLWQKQLKRYAKKALNDPTLNKLSQLGRPIANPFLVQLSRLALMVGDHNYSSLKIDSPQRVLGSLNWQNTLIANTDKTGSANQSLDEHLLGVADMTAKFCRSLPILHENLPRLDKHEPLAKNTAGELFLWQNKAFKLASMHSEDSHINGFFGVNMASTGRGKTIGNARIMYALAGEKGARLTIALGLRVLTLQTGQSFRKNLELSDSQLAILVGGLAQKQLFENNALSGSESDQTLLDGLVDSDDFADIVADLKLGTVLDAKNAQNLLICPVVTCTIDHLMQACEGSRGGRYIVPLLRLFGSDLILDEPDDFDQSDLPALSRLVHLAGVFGSRVLLSSATLPPDLVQGLFNAYLAGRKIYNAQFNKPNPSVVCAWFDENDCNATQCKTVEIFNHHHANFIQKRLSFLKKEPIRKMAKILPIQAKFNGEKPQEFYSTIAEQLLGNAINLHSKNHIILDDKKISIGLIRMANIQPLMQIAEAFYRLKSAHLNDAQIYLCCYHSQQILALRNRLETRLDAVLSRKNISDKEWAKQADIADFIHKNPNKNNHLFIVLATPVAEVGRDHDYDWAMVEPSSMRSIIQLAGRVKRHRPHLFADTPNVGIWSHNIRALKNENIVFTRPGFENDKDDDKYVLNTKNTTELIDKNILTQLDAKCRISKNPTLNIKESLADLEQAVMEDLMNNNKPNVVNSYFDNEETASRHHLHLSLLTPFRAGRANSDFIVVPSDDDGTHFKHKAQVDEHGLNCKNASEITPKRLDTQNDNVSVWLAQSVADELRQLAQAFPELSKSERIKRFLGVSLAENAVFYFDERFGFWRKD